MIDFETPVPGTNREGRVVHEGAEEMEIEQLLADIDDIIETRTHAVAMIRGRCTR